MPRGIVVPGLALSKNRCSARELRTKLAKTKKQIYRDSTPVNLRVISTFGVD